MSHRILRVLFPVLLACVSCQKGISHTGPLYIINVEGKYGVCDARKRTVVPAKYFNVEVDDSFFIAQKEAGVFDIYSIHGIFIDSCNLMKKVTDTTMLIFWSTSGKPPGSLEKAKRTYAPYGNTEKSSGTLISVSGKKDALPGRVVWYPGREYNKYCTIDSAGFTGLLQLSPYKVILPIRYKRITPKSDGYFLAWNDSTDFKLADLSGHDYRISPLVDKSENILFHARLFTVDSGKEFKIVYNAEGKRVNVIRGISNANFSTTDKMLLVNGVQGITEIDSAGAAHGDFPPPSGPANLTDDVYVTKDGLYNIRKGNYVVRTRDTSVSVYNNLSVGLKYSSATKGILTIYDAHGNVIVSIPRYFVGYRDKNDLYKTFSNANFYRAKNTDPFMVYNISLTKKFPVTFDDVLFLRGSNSGVLYVDNNNFGRWANHPGPFFMGKKEGRWGVFCVVKDTMMVGGMITDSLVTVLPPVYDTIKEYFGPWQTTRDGVKQWYDNYGRPLAGGKPFDILTDQVSDGKRLAFEGHMQSEGYYTEYIVYTKFLVIDSTGNITASLPVHLENRNGYPHFLFFRDRLLFFDKGHKIWHTKTSKIANIENCGFRDDDIVSTANGPLAVVCTDKNNNEGVYSLPEEKIVIPCGKFKQIRLRPYGKTAVGVYTNPFDDKRVLAIYDENGEVY